MWNLVAWFVAIMLVTSNTFASDSLGYEYRVVVFDIVNHDSTASSDNPGAVATIFLTEALLEGKANGFIVLERESFPKLLKDRSLAGKLHQVFDKKTAIELGKALEANFAVFGDLHANRDSTLLSVRVVSSVTTEIVAYRGTQWLTGSGIPREAIRGIGKDIHESLLDSTKANPYRHVDTTWSKNGFPAVRIGVGFEYQNGRDRVTFGNVPQDIRTTPPHPDDLLHRPDDILDPQVPDNYLVRDNWAYVNLGSKKAFDVEVGLWGVIAVVIRTSAIEGSGQNLNENHFRKEYISPSPGDLYAGSALIYYALQAKDRDFFDKSSFSIRVCLSYPILYFGKSRKHVLRVVAGTNVLLPARIELRSEQGWDRFGAQEIQQTRDVGELREVDWVYGIDFEVIPADYFRLSVQFTVVHTDYQEKLNIPLLLEADTRGRPTFKMSWSWGF